MTDNYGNTSQPQIPNMPPPPPGGHQSVPPPPQPPQGAGYQGPPQGQSYQPPAAGYGAGPGGPGAPAGAGPGWVQGYEQQSNGNFFANLFDFTFKRYIAESVVKVLFILLLVAFGIGYLFTVIVSFANSAGSGFLALILGGLFALLYLILIRVSLESIVASVQAAKNTEKILQRL